MALEKDSIKDLFSSKLGNSFEPDVPTSIWSGIDQLLPDEPSAVDSSSTQSTATNTTTTVAKAGAIKAVAIAAGIAALVTTTVLIIPSDHESDNIKDNAIQQTEHVEGRLEPTLKENIDSNDSTEPLSTHKLVAVNNSTRFNNPVVDANEEDVAEKRGPSKNIDPSTNKNLENLPELEIEDLAPLVLPKSSFYNGISIGFNGNVGILADNHYQNGGVLLFSDKNQSLEDYIAQSNSNFELHHNQPISFGITLDKRISPKLSIETGILYTYLRSTIQSTNGLIIDEKQEFHYLGIPLYVNYDLYKTDKIRLYLSLGGLIQKDIKGKYKSFMLPSSSGSTGKGLILNEPYLNEELYLSPNLGGLVGSGSIYNLDENIHQDNLQLSGHLLIGVSYPLYKKLYLYGTIGGAYYFDAKNKYRTIYSDKQTQIDVNLGFKFNF